MSETAIVTGFIDIGRSDWATHARKNEEYFKYFSNLAMLENTMYVFTEQKFVNDILNLRDGRPTHIEVVDIKKDFNDLLQKIALVQNSTYFKSMIGESVKSSPEYCIPEYVLLMFLKFYYLNYFIETYNIENKNVSWVDFGYLRESTLTKNKKSFTFNCEDKKIHLFTLKNISDNVDVRYSIFNNDVFIQGSSFVGDSTSCKKLYLYFKESFNSLINDNIVDDDQGILLDVYIKNPNFFKLHNTNNEWFTMFRDYNSLEEENE
jgi:protein YibB